MKFLNILLLSFIIQFILAADDATTTKEFEYEDSEPKNNCMIKENPKSFEECKDLAVTNSDNKCCFFSFVSGVNIVQKCYEIKDDKYAKEQFINSLESRKVVKDVKKYDDVEIDCSFLNFVKYNKYINLFLLLLL